MPAKSKQKKCPTPWCRNDSAPGRKHCHKCRSRSYREKHPYRYYYNVLRLNASRRGIEFNLSFRRFKKLWTDHPKKWKEKLAQKTCRWEVDRIDINRGYADDNVQLLSKRENIRKYWEKDRLKVTADWTEVKESPIEKAPF